MSHIHDKIDFTAEVFIVHNNKVLLRKHDKYRIWLSVGGHVELDEDPNQAAIREVKEEVGLDVTLYDTRTYHEASAGYTELIAPQFLSRNRISDTHEHVTLVYFATTSTDVTTNEGREASEDMHWFTKEEIDDPTFGVVPNVRFYAHAALNTLAGQ